jgi:YVTN family beta-propeller protein
VGAQPVSATVNPITNKLYVANQLGDSVTVIDGATNIATTVSVGSQPVAIAVNSLTNKIYVANYLDGTISVIDGVTNSSTTVAVGSQPVSIAVNPAANKVYVANYLSATVTIVDGLTNATQTVAAGIAPVSVAVNPVSNKVYVANQLSSTVTVIDGATQKEVTVACGSQPVSIAVNVVTNKIFAANSGDNSVTVIDGVTNGTDTVAVGSQPAALLVNPVSQEVFVLNAQSPFVTVISGASYQTANVSVSLGSSSAVLNPLTGDIYVASSGGSGGSLTRIQDSTKATSTVLTGIAATALAVNAVTNKLYVAQDGPYSVANGAVTVLDGAAYNVTSITAGASPVAVGLNEMTNRAYVANSGDSTVTVFDAATSATSTVAVGVTPVAIGVNPTTNRIYVADQGSGDVAVVDGVTSLVTKIPVGISPAALEVNPITNQVYVADQGSGTVHVINGTSGLTSVVQVGVNPGALAVDAVRNRVYVANQSGGSVTTIDGATGVTSTVAVGTSPVAIKVNAVTNQVYVANRDSASVTVIDGDTGATTTVATDTSPSAIAINTVTNKIYIANKGSGTVSVIDGATNAVRSVAVGSPPIAIAADPAGNKVYVATANGGAGEIVVIDATTLTSWVVGAGVGVVPGSLALAFNAMTDHTYVVTSSGLSVISPQDVESVPLEANILPFANNSTNIAALSVNFNANSDFSPATPVEGVYFQVDTWQNAWTAATLSGSLYLGTLNALEPGPHILYAYSTDGQESTLTGAGSPLVGTIQAYSFLVTQQVQTISFGPIAEQLLGTELTLSASVSSGLALTYTSVTPQICSVSGGIASFLTPGVCTLTVSQNGNSAYLQASSVSQSFPVLTALSIQEARLPAGTLGVPYSAALSAQGGTSPYQWSLASGSLPAGLTLATATGTIMGTPSSLGTSSFVANVSDASSPALTVSKSLTITVSPATLKIATSSLPAGTAGLSYQANLLAQGGTVPYLQWSVESGTLPSGLVLNGAAGTISGTPTGAGTVTFTVSVSDSGSPAQTVTQTLSLVIGPGLSISSTGLPQATVGIAYSASLSGQNGTLPYTWSITRGSLPGGVSLNPTTGVISGTPVATGVFPLLVQLTDTSTPTPQVADQLFSLVVSAQNIGPSAISFTISGVPATAAPATEITTGILQLSQAGSAAISGTLTVSLNAAEAGLPDGYVGDAGFGAGNGTKTSTSSVVIPAGTTSMQIPGFDPGTVAGEITVSLAISGQTVAGANSTIEQAVPTIVSDSVQITNITATGFEVELVGTSTTRDLDSATFTFTPSAGSGIAGLSTFVVDLKSTLATWFASSSGLEYGGAFSLVVPFTLSGSATALSSVSVTLTNSIGTSAPVKGTL